MQSKQASSSRDLRDMDPQRYPPDNTKPIPTNEVPKTKPHLRIFNPLVPLVTPIPTPFPVANRGVLLIPRDSRDPMGFPSASVTADSPISLLHWLGRLTPTINEDGLTPSGASGKAGLLNNGYTCYFNAVAQALMHCPSFINLILSHPWPKQSTASPECIKFCESFLDFALQYWTGRQNALNPHNILADLRKYNSFFTAYHQHDAHEALRSILSAIDDTTTATFRSAHNANALRRKNKTEPPANALQRLLRPFDDNGTSIMPPFAPVRWVFEGSLETATVCNKCGNTSRRCEQWQDVQLPLPSDEDAAAIRKERGESEPSRGFFGSIIDKFKGQQALSLELCLKAVCASSMLTGENSYFCDKCRCKVDATNRSAFATLPPVLTFQLQRFNANGSKSTRSVAFPLTGLDMAPYLSSAATGDLRAAVKEDDLTDTLSDGTTSSSPVFGAPMAPEDALSPATASASALTRAGHTCPGPHSTATVAATLRSNAPREWARLHREGVHGYPLAEALQPRAVPAESTVYDLVALVKHMGSAVDGHYVAFVKHQLDGKWYFCDDSSVRPVSAKDVEMQEAYLLFYQRRAAPTASALPGGKSSTSTSSATAPASPTIDPRVAAAASPIAAAAASDPSSLLRAETLLNLIALERDAVAAAKDKSKSMLVSASWLARVAATRSVSSVDNRDLYCAHSRVLQLDWNLRVGSTPPSRVLDAALVSREAYVALMRAVGGGPHVSLYDTARFLRAHGASVASVTSSDVFAALKLAWGLRESDVTAILSANHPYASAQPLVTADEAVALNGSVGKGVCQECRDLHQRAFERERIGSLDRQAKIKSAEDAPYLMLPRAWLHVWRAYVQANGVRPGPIDNSVLLMPDGQPREGLNVLTDYCGLHAEVFHALLGFYGGGPVIVRKNQDIYDISPLSNAYDPETGLLRE